MRCWANNLLLIIVLVLAAGQMLTACGQKGGLYLPDSNPPTAPSDRQEKNNG